MTGPREVIKYLQNNPSFFEENQDLLTELENGTSDDTAQFYERQLEVLKEREARHKAKIDIIVDSAESNLRLESELLDLAVALLGRKNSGPDPVNFAIAMIKRQFNVAQARIILASEHAGILPYYDEVRQRVAHGNSVCDDRVSSRLLGQLFDDQAENIQSCAFIPIIYGEQRNGVLVLGSSVREKFHPGAGVLFLDRLGLLLGGFIRGAG